MCIRDSSGTLDPAGAWQALVHISSGAAGLVFPVLLMMLIAVAAAQLLQFGLLITFKPLEPNLERLDPIQGLKRIFGISGLIRVSLDSMKVLVVLLVAGLTAWQYAPDVLALPLLDMRAIAPKVGWMLVDLSIRIGGVLLLLGVLDLLYQRWKYKEDLSLIHI